MVAYINRMGFFFGIQVPSMDVLCAMKFATILTRAKGRDFYDAIFLLSKVKPNLDFLTARAGIASFEALKIAVLDKLKTVDLSQKKRDFSHLLFNEANAERIMLFAEIMNEMF